MREVIEDTPAPAYSGYLEQMIERIAHKAATAQPLISAHRGAPAQLRTQVSDTVQALADELVALSHDVHAHPELGNAEHHAVAAIARLLASHGHEAEVGAYGLATALRVRAGCGRPQVAILAEYDALPGIGHACGHNVICATAVGAFLAAAAVIDQTAGSVQLVGTPAEESSGGKELIARTGGFDDIDTAVMTHPFSFDIAEHPWLGARIVNVTFHGRAAHAAAMPFLGRNALDAVVQAYTSIAALRQHILPTDRIHGIIIDGGQTRNIVPERAAAEFSVRSGEVATLVDLSQRVQAIFHGAAAATDTRAEIIWDLTPAYLPVRNNSTLAARWATNIAGRGRQALPPGIVPETLTGSSDLGNISVRIPAIQPLLAIAPPHVALHSREFADWARSPRADLGCIDGAAGLALTAVDYLYDPELQQATNAEFQAAGGHLDPETLFNSTQHYQPQTTPSEQA